MNKVLTSIQIKSDKPLLASNAATFELGGRSFSVRSSQFDMMQEVEDFVKEHAGRIIIFDQPNLFTPDVPHRDGDKFVLRYVIIPNFHDIITRLVQLAEPNLTPDLRKTLDEYNGK